MKMTGTANDLIDFLDRLVYELGEGYFTLQNSLRLDLSDQTTNLTMALAWIENNREKAISDIGKTGEVDIPIDFLLEYIGG